MFQYVYVRSGTTWTQQMKLANPRFQSSPRDLLMGEPRLPCPDGRAAPPTQRQQLDILQYLTIERTSATLSVALAPDTAVMAGWSGLWNEIRSGSTASPLSTIATERASILRRRRVLRLRARQRLR
jgi:hypothetical protein